MRMRYDWLTDFLFAGSSALLWSVSHTLPNAWPLGLAALVPFLWRVLGARPLTAVRTSCLLVAACGLASFDSNMTWLGRGAADLVLAGGLIVLFSLIARRLAAGSWIDVLLVALLWLPTEYLLGSMGFGLGSSVPSHAPILGAMASLLGTVFVSFLLVLVNAAAVCVIDRVARCRVTRYAFARATSARFLVPASQMMADSNMHGPSSQRAPPALA